MNDYICLDIDKAHDILTSVSIPTERDKLFSAYLPDNPFFVGWRSNTRDRLRNLLLADLCHYMPLPTLDFKLPNWGRLRDDLIQLFIDTVELFLLLRFNMGSSAKEMERLVSSLTVGGLTRISILKSSLRIRSIDSAYIRSTPNRHETTISERIFYGLAFLYLRSFN